MMKCGRFLAAMLVLAVASVQTSRGGEECPITKAMNDLPKITYQVGAEEVCCAEAAATLAEKNKTPIVYRVGKQSFDNEPSAMTALVEVTEKFVNDFATPCKCDVSGTTTVAGKEVCCEASAAETAKIVAAAMKKVEMTYLVGEKKCNCPVEAAALAKQTGEKQVFIVDGQPTCCSTTARLKLAHAKYKAAVEALAAGQKKEGNES
jgi:hypothetical protein